MYVAHNCKYINTNSLQSSTLCGSWQQYWPRLVSDQLWSYMLCFKLIRSLMADLLCNIAVVGLPSFGCQAVTPGVKTAGPKVNNKGYSKGYVCSDSDSGGLRDRLRLPCIEGGVQTESTIAL